MEQLVGVIQTPAVLSALFAILGFGVGMFDLSRGRVAWFGLVSIILALTCLVVAYLGNMQWLMMIFLAAALATRAVLAVREYSDSPILLNTTPVVKLLLVMFQERRVREAQEAARNSRTPST